MPPDAKATVSSSSTERQCVYMLMEDREAIHVPVQDVRADRCHYVVTSHIRRGTDQAAAHL